MAQDTLNKLPWWQNVKVVTALGALIAAAMPVTTLVSGFIQRGTELQLNAQKQSHKIRMDYINRALSPNMAEADRELIFGLFAEMEDQPALQRWGKTRQKSLVSKISALEQKLKIKEEQEAKQKEIIKKTDKAEEKLEGKIAEKEANNAPEEEIEALKEELRLNREKSEADLVKFQELRKNNEELRIRVGEFTEIQVPKQLKPTTLVEKFSGPERKVASSQLMEFYEEDPESVIDTLIDGILPEFDKRSYRVNLYIAYTLANLPSKWRGSTKQKRTIERLRLTRNYINDSTFERRVEQALKNYAGT